MEITEDSFSLRSMCGLVKIASDSAFVPGCGSSSYSEEAECDVIVESNGFRANKVVLLGMPDVAAFLGELQALVDRGEGRASLANRGEEFSLAFVCERGLARVECAMSDARDGGENFVRIKYAVDPDYYTALRRELARVRI